ncbi:MAG: hypothetical protein WCO71_08275 [Pseudomonadota bacterium]
MKYLLFSCVLISVAASACSSANFGGGTDSGPKAAKKAKQEDAKKIDPAPNDAIPAEPTHVYSITDLDQSVLAEGLEGSCKQGYVGNKGNSIGINNTFYESLILPPLQNNKKINLTTVKIRGQEFDTLLFSAFLVCQAPSDSYIFKQQQDYCVPPVGGIVGFPMGDIKVCDQLYSNQHSFGQRPSDFSSVSPDGGVTNHLLISTRFFGSAISSDSFMDAVRKKFGAAVKVSIVYPKSADCFYKFNPPQADTYWKMPSMEKARTPSSLFEDVAKASGGKTFDLCSDPDLASLESSL